MQTIDIAIARTEIARLLDDAIAGEDIVIERDGEPVARLVPMIPSRPVKQRMFGALAGKITVPENFDDPLPDDILDLFEGR